MLVRNRALGHRRPRKRIEIERMADKKRPRSPERTADQVRLTRRAFAFQGLAATSFAALTGRLWWLQIHEYESAKAQVQVFSQRIFQLPAARGMLYDADRKLLADNFKSWSVAILPASLPKDKSARAAIFATLANHLKMADIVTIAPAGLPERQDAKGEVYARLAAAIGVPIDDVRSPIERELKLAKRQKRDPQAKVKVPWNLAGAELPPERVEAARAVAEELPDRCVVVVNPIAYIDEVYRVADPYVPKIVKAGISKEIALGIEANRIYLPGVQIDDSELNRRYHVGAELGHIIGYTGPITQEEYDEHIERDERGRPILDSAGDPIPIYRDHDYLGKAGIEAGLEALLRGRRGRSVAKINADGKIVGEYPAYRRDPIDGDSVVLTIALDYQNEVIRILDEGIARGKAWVEEKNKEAKAENRPDRIRTIPPPAGAAVALNPKTGEILALVSLPGYDPRHFAEGITQKQLDEYLEKTVPGDQKRYPLQDRCVASTFPPGSTMKTFIAAAGLQEGVIKPDTKFRCLGDIRIPLQWNEYGGTRFYCWTRDAQHQELTVKEALATSCDVFFYNLGGPKQTDIDTHIDTHYYDPDSPEPRWFNGLGIERINNYLQAFGFGKKTGIELGDEVKGLIPGIAWKETNFEGNGRFWSLGDTIVTAIGQGYDLVTPLQLCNATAAIANRGTLYKPTLVRELVDAEGKTKRGLTPTVVRKLPIDPAHLEVVREGMRMNITWHRDNTVKGLVAPKFDEQGRPVPGSEQFPLPEGIDAGVKTGTAEFDDTKTDKDGLRLRAHAWCAAFAPYNDPEICVVAFVEGGNASAAVAAPVANGMIRAWFERKNRPKQG